MSYQVSIMGGSDIPDASVYKDPNVKKIIEFNTMEELSQIVCDYHIAPALFHNDYRRAANAYEINILVLDFDDGLTIQEAKNRLDNLKLSYVIGTSKSHQKDKGGKVCDRFHVFIPLRAPIRNTQDYAATWLAFSEKHFPEADRACKDISRLFCRSREVVCFCDEGAGVEVVLRAQDSKKLNDSNNLHFNINMLTKRSKQFLLICAPPGTQHVEHRDCLMDMRDNGCSQEFARTLTKSSFENNNYAWDDKCEARVKDIFSRPKSGLTKAWPEVIKVKPNVFRARPTSPKNTIYLVEDLMGWKLFYNELEGAVYVKKLNKGELNLFSDTDISVLKTKADNLGYVVPKDSMIQHIETRALEAKYHPLKDPILARQNKRKESGDRTSYIDQLASTFVIDHDYSILDESPEDHTKRCALYLKKWLVASMARLFQTGCENQILLLYGEQNLGKSRWFQRLSFAPKVINSSPLELKSRSHRVQMGECLIWLSDEFDAITSKEDITLLKSITSWTGGKVRKPYGRYAEHITPICSFAGASNRSDLLKDPTGNRRFLIIPLKEIKAGLEIDPLDIFAEAKTLLDEGYRHWFDYDEIKVLTDGQAEFISSDLAQAISLNVQPGEHFWVQFEMMALIDKLGTGKFSPKIAGDLWEILYKRRRDIEHTRRRVNGKRYRGILINIPNPNRRSTNLTVVRERGDNEGAELPPKESK